MLDALDSCERNGEMNEFMVAYSLIHDYKQMYKDKTGIDSLKKFSFLNRKSPQSN